MWLQPAFKAVAIGVLSICCCVASAKRVWADERDELFQAFDKGMALHKQGKYQEAVPYFEKALSLAPRVFGPEHENTAVTFNNLGFLYWQMGEYAKAESLHRRSLRIREAIVGKDHPDVAQSLHNLALVYQSLGQIAKAEPLFRRSLEIREANSGEDLDAADTLNSLGTLYKNMGQYSKAESLYRRSLKIREAKLGKDHPDVAGSLHNLALLYRLMGEYEKAEPLYRRGLEIFEKQRGKNHPEVAICLNNLAELYRDIGQYEKAESLYSRAIEIREARLGKDHPDVGQSVNDLAELYWNMGQYGKAEPLFSRSLEIFEKKLGKDHFKVGQSLNNLGLLYWQMGEYAKAEPLYRRAIENWEFNFGKDNRDVAMALNNLALLFKDMGEYEKAEPLYNRSLKIREAGLAKDHPDLAQSLDNLANLHAAEKRWPKALAEQDRARRVIRRHSLRVLPLLTPREQLSFLKNNDEKSFHAALSLALLGRDEANAVAFSAGWVLNGKAVTEEVLAQQALKVRGQGESSTAAPSPSEAPDPWVPAEKVRTALSPDAVLIEIARFNVANFEAKGGHKRWQTPHYAAWVIPAAGKGEIRLVDLGDADQIDRAVKSFRKAMQEAPALIRQQGEPEAEHALRQRLQGLSEMVLQPLLTHVGQAPRWYLSPDASLWLVPWGALPLPDSSYAIEKHQIQYLVSGRDLLRERSTRKPNRPLIFADPDYDLAIAEARNRARELLADTPTYKGSNSRVFPVPIPSVGRLPGTAAEAQAIAPKLQVYLKQEPWVYKGKNALETVIKNAPGPRILVLSTHGFFLPDQEVQPSPGGDMPVFGYTRAVVLTKEGKPLENPLHRCGLLLAGCNQRRQGKETDEDGILTGQEIVGCDLRGTKLVVLSACDTGLGDVRTGEGVAGLRQAFQLAGAEAVVATLWQVPDRQSAQLMSAFFENLTENSDRAAALRKAQLAMIAKRRQGNTAAHPFFWAAFTVTGTWDGTQRETQR